jgi:hypothetical protein
MMEAPSAPNAIQAAYLTLELEVEADENPTGEAEAEVEEEEHDENLRSDENIPFVAGNMNIINTLIRKMI